MLHLRNALQLNWQVAGTTEPSPYRNKEDKDYMWHTGIEKIKWDYIWSQCIL